MSNAQNHAALLAALMGSQVDSIVAVTDETATGVSPTAISLCNVTQQRQWHTLPLTTDLSTALRIEVPLTLRVTFAVRPALVIDTPTPSPSQSVPATVTPVSLSPLPTP